MLVPYTGTSIAVWGSWSIFGHTCSDSIANWQQTSEFADFDILCSPHTSLFWHNYLHSLSNDFRHWSEWFCWLHSRENSHNVYIAPITILSLAQSAALLPYSLDLKRINEQFTPTGLIRLSISLPFLKPTVNNSNNNEASWRTGSQWTDVAQSSKWSLVLLAFRYVCSQFSQFFMFIWCG